MKKSILLLWISLFILFFQVSMAQVIEKKSNAIDANYKRSSLFTLMITNESRQYEEAIKAFFLEKVVPDKYNNHNLGNRTIAATGQRNELDNIVNYLNENKIANQLVAKCLIDLQKVDLI